MVFYVTEGKKKRFKLWHWIVGLLLIVSLSTLSVIVTFEVIYATVDVANKALSLKISVDDEKSVFNFFLLMMSFPPILISIFVVYKFWHGSNLINLVSARNNFDLVIILKVSLICLFLTFLCLLVEYCFIRSPNEIILKNIDLTYVLCLIIVILCVPFQVLTEEIFFRGYLTDFANTYIKLDIIGWIIISLIFGLFHFDGNFQLPHFLALFTVGMTASLLRYVRDGLELSVAYHLALNVTAFSIVGYNSPDMPVSYIFERTKNSVDWIALGVIFLNAVLVLVVCHKLKNIFLNDKIHITRVDGL